MVEPISAEEFLDKKYRVDFRAGEKFTPHGYKIYTHHKRSLNDIPLDYVMKTASHIMVDKKRDTHVKIISLEGIIVSKFRAGREQDVEDLGRLARAKIVWDRVRYLAKDDTEYGRIRSAIELYSKQ